MNNRWELESEARFAGRSALREVSARIGAPSDDTVWRSAGSTDAWTCPVCSETVTAVMEQDPFMGEVSHFPRCRCQREAHDAAYNSVLRDGWHQVVPHHIQDADIPARFISASFGTFKARLGTDKAVKACKAYADNFKVGETSMGLYLAGGVGTGKTHLAIATMRALIDKTLVQARFVSVAGLLNKIKAGTSDRPFDFGLVEKAVEVEFLLLDDLGAENVTPFAKDILFQVIDGRYQANKPLLVTSNLGDKQQAQRLDARMMDRLYEMCRAVKLDEATSYRKELAQGAQA